MLSLDRTMHFLLFSFYLFSSSIPSCDLLLDLYFFLFALLFLGERSFVDVSLCQEELVWWRFVVWVSSNLTFLEVALIKCILNPKNTSRESKIPQNSNRPKCAKIYHSPHPSITVLTTFHTEFSLKFVCERFLNRFRILCLLNELSEY